MPIHILDGTNPHATGIDVFADPELAEFAREHAPPNADKGAQRVVWLSRADCSLHSDRTVDVFMKHVTDDRNPILARQSADHLLASFCPLKTVGRLIERGVPRDFAGVIATDHELPPWCSTLHSDVYFDLREAINAAFPAACVCEYAGVATDWGNRPDYEVSAMDAVSRMNLCPMGSLYVPAGYFDDLVKFAALVKSNTNRWERNGFVEYVAINPIVQGTYKGNDYAAGQIVPPEVQAIVIGEIIRIGASPVIWQAYTDSKQAGVVAKAISESIVPAVERLEAEQ